jgi:hypothetical protein
MQSFRCWIPCLLWLCAANLSSAHTLEEIRQAFPDQTEALPDDLLELTRLLDGAAGTNSVREDLHERQHRLLLDHVRTHIDRKCADLVAKLPLLDQDIVRLRDQEKVEEEQKLREIRDGAQTFIALNCKPIH